MPIKDVEQRKKYYELKYAKAKENCLVCEVCNKTYNMFTQNNHMKSKNHLNMVEIYNLKNQVEQMKNLIT